MASSERSDLENYLDLAAQHGTVVRDLPSPDAAPRGFVSFSIAEFDTFTNALVQTVLDDERAPPVITDEDEALVASTLLPTIRSICERLFGPDRNLWPEDDPWVVGYFELHEAYVIYEEGQV